MAFRGIPTVIFGTSDMSKDQYFNIQEINSQNYQSTYNVMGFISENELDVGKEVLGNLKIVSDFNSFFDFARRIRILAVSILPDSKIISEDNMKKILEMKNLVFPNFVNPKATIKNGVMMGIGNIVMENSVICTGSVLRDFNYLDTSSIVGHNAKIGSFNTFAPITYISPNANIEDKVIIETGSKVLENINVAQNAIVSAGSVVTKDVGETLVVSGMPAKATHTNRNII